MNYGKNLSHAYIISGPPEEGFEKARELAAAMLCTAPDRRPCGMCRSCAKVKRGIHPDVIITQRQTDDKGKPRREIYVDQVREIADSSAILPNEAEKKVYIVRDAGTMNLNAQNAFLKLLEEPPRFDAFILLCDNAGQLLETVRSRCVAINLKGGDVEPSAQARELSEKYMALAAKRNTVGLLSFLNVNGDLPAADAADFVESNISMLSDMLCGYLPDLGMSRAELMRLVALMQRAREYLRFNVSVKHVFGLLSARTIELK